MCLRATARIRRVERLVPQLIMLNALVVDRLVITIFLFGVAGTPAIPLLLLLRRVLLLLWQELLLSSLFL